MICIRKSKSTNKKPGSFFLKGRLGAKIENLKGLDFAAYMKWSVVVPNSHAFGKPKPAAFIINLPGIIILKLMKSGMFLYHKGE